MSSLLPTVRVIYRALMTTLEVTETLWKLRSKCRGSENLRPCRKSQRNRSTGDFRTQIFSYRHQMRVQVTAVHQKKIIMKCAKEVAKIVVAKPLHLIDTYFSVCSALATMSLAHARIREAIRDTCSMRTSGTNLPRM